jgi:SAM-dependent methyltransferase
VNEPGLLDDPVAFWEERHAALDPWRSGGDRGLSAEENFEFYACRLGRLLELIRRHAGGERPLRILDAGCGRGHLTDGLRRCGHRVTGIDSSATAVAWAREAYGPWFEQCRLEGYRAPTPIDVVVCVDVLFHVLDDAEWRTALCAFGRYAAAESLLIVTDVFPSGRYAARDYIVHRAAAEYDSLLQELDFRLAERLPYAFGGNPNQFAVYRRTA